MWIAEQYAINLLLSRRLTEKERIGRTGLISCDQQTVDASSISAYKSRLTDVRENWMGFLWAGPLSHTSLWDNVRLWLTSQQIHT